MKRSDLIASVLIPFFEEREGKRPAGIQVGRFVFIGKRPIGYRNGYPVYQAVRYKGLVYIPIHPYSLVGNYNYLLVDGDTLTVYPEPFVTSPPPSTPRAQINVSEVDEATKEDLGMLKSLRIIRLPDDFLKRRFAGWDAAWLPSELKKKLTTGKRWQTAIEWGTLPLFKEKTRKKILQTFLGQYAHQWRTRQPTLWKDFLESFVADVCKGDTTKCPEEIWIEMV